MLGYQTCADLFDALGEGEQARAAVQAGHRELMARAEKISDPEWRRPFLGDVPEHPTIVELWENAGGLPQRCVNCRRPGR